MMMVSGGQINEDEVVSTGQRIFDPELVRNELERAFRLQSGQLTTSLINQGFFNPASVGQVQLTQQELTELTDFARATARQVVKNAMLNGQQQDQLNQLVNDLDNVQSANDTQALFSLLKFLATTN